MILKKMATVPLEAEVQAEVSLINKPNAKSTIWKYFGFFPYENGKPINTEKPQCKMLNMLRNCFHKDEQHNEFTLPSLTKAPTTVRRVDENK